MKKHNHVVYGDSVTGETMIRVANGNQVPIRSLFGDVDHTMGDKEYSHVALDALTYDKVGKTCVYRPIKYVMRHKTNKLLYRVSLNNMTYIDVTEDHSLIGYANTTYRKKHKCDALIEMPPQQLGGGVNSLLRLASVPYTIDAPRYPDYIMEFLGLVIGDGYLTRGDLSLSIGTLDIAEITDKILNKLVDEGWAKTFHVRPNGHDVRITGSKIVACVRDSLYSTGTKNIPIWVYNQPQSQIQAFLRGLYTANGTISTHGLIRLTTVRDDIAHGVRELLLRVGIASTNFKERTENTYLSKHSGTLGKHVNIVYRELFGKSIGFILNRKQGRIKFQNIIHGSTSLGSDIHLVRVMNVECIGECTDYVYDIEVDDTHLFFANDILVHNTDSVYLTLSDYAKNNDIEMNNDIAVSIADTLQKTLQNDLPNILGAKFITSPKEIEILEPGREIVATRGLFKDAKKRYALYITDDEGKKVAKLKIMGMETKRSDTPKFMQEFLVECLEHVVKDGKNYADVKELVDKFRVTYRKMDPWRQGSPGRVKNLNTKHMLREYWLENSTNIGVKYPQMHFIVKAALNTNWLMEYHNEQRWGPIRDGDKVEVIYLKPNPEGLASVAIPVGETYIPDWVKALPFDIELMEEKLLDKKLFNVIGDAMRWDFYPQKTYIDDIADTVDDFYE